MKHSIIRRFFPFALALMVFFSISKTNLRGYVTGGHAWATSQVLYYINPQNIFLSDHLRDAADAYPGNPDSGAGLDGSNARQRSIGVRRQYQWIVGHV